MYGIQKDVTSCRDSVLGTSTRLRVGQVMNRGSIACRIKTLFSSHSHSKRLWGPPSLVSTVSRAFYPKIKRPGREFNHWPLSNTEIKSEWSYTSHPHMPAWRAQGNFTSTVGVVRYKLLRVLWYTALLLGVSSVLYEQVGWEKLAITPTLRCSHGQELWNQTL
jgi:hypothetical protein